MNIKTPFVYLFLTILFLSGCGMAGLPFSGQVTDAETDEPVEGVIVVALWRGATFNSSSSCYHVETAVSDEKGRYRIPGWIGGRFGMAHGNVITEAYKKGYERVPVNGRYPNDELKLARFLGNDAQWLEYLSKYVSSASCSGGGVSRKNLFKFYKKIYEDADNIAVTKDQRKVVDRIRYAAASAGVAAPMDMSSLQAEKLEKKFIEEYMP